MIPDAGDDLLDVVGNLSRSVRGQMEPGAGRVGREIVSHHEFRRAAREAKRTAVPEPLPALGEDHRGMKHAVARIVEDFVEPAAWTRLNKKLGRLLAEVMIPPGADVAGDSVVDLGGSRS